MLSNRYTGIPRFMLLMWRHKNKTTEQKPRISRLLSSTKGEENELKREMVQMKPRR